MVALLLAWWCSTSGATGPADVGELQLEREPDGLYLSTQLRVALPDLAENALYKGIPMYFAAEAQVVREIFRRYTDDDADLKPGKVKEVLGD